MATQVSRGRPLTAERRFFAGMTVAMIASQFLRIAVWDNPAWLAFARAVGLVA
ncbi:hypothetical protein [Rhizorhabdus dicambivorans]|uniref:hypothetical protein n=1 Tax=Rhizorhabdus dicambivorans TaxID=1850238 RepID=UPI001596C5A1|nr:hypothetical protein [Rhizorhabdus dicambivorans]